MNTEEEKVIKQYKDINIISEKEKSIVALVIDEEHKQIAVKKIIRNCKPDLYYILQSLSSVHIPKITQSMMKNRNFALHVDRK